MASHIQLKILLQIDRKNLIIWHDTYEKRNGLIIIVYLKALMADNSLFEGINGCDGVFTTVRTYKQIIILNFILLKILIYYL